MIDFKVIKRKISKDEFRYDVNYTLKLPFSDDIGMIANIDISKWGMGGWGMNAYKHESAQPCGDCLKFGKNEFGTFLTSSGLEVKCPIEPGSYMAKNLQFDGKVEGLDELPYGKYKMIVKYTRGEEVVGCWSVFAEIEEVVA
ncbi:uncharacterized protein [Anabrus simplex]|uniref:uncharacterized protein n=1 Tax=Anabrus simplex TaxID=316456 RepID=UPI0035A35198